MSTIKPFKAVYYNEKKIKDFRKVVAPPYDVISAEEQTILHNLSPYNFTQIDLGKDKPSDDKKNNKYTRAKAVFEQWLDKEIIIKDDKPCLYFYKQDYTILGQKNSRLGFISLLELQDESGSKVYPHENTHAHAVEDRLSLTKSLNAQLSSIFVCYSDREKKVEKIFTKYLMAKEPFIDVEDNDKVRHYVWKLEDEALIKEVADMLEDEQLFIADGHHRYKVANEYRKLKMSRKTSSKDEPYNYVMTYFTNIDSKGLQIFPMHRILKKLPKELDFLDEHFRVDKVRNKSELQILLAQAGKNEHAFGLYTSGETKLLRLKNKLLIDKMVKDGSSEYKSLDATILKCFIFDLLGVKSEDIVYTKNFNEVIDMVDSRKAEAGFIMNPVSIMQLKAIALNGEKMPPKTTYFYPKVLSGLTVYKMD